MNPNSTYIVSCIDGSTFSAAVCDYAAWVAKRVQQPLQLLHTIEQSPEPATCDFSGAIGLGTSTELLEELTQLEQNRGQLLIQQGKQMLATAKTKAAQTGLSAITLTQRHGNLTETLVELEKQTQLVVVGIRGEQHAQEQAVGIGAQIETLIRALHKPILVVNQAFTPPQNIMLAYDGSDSANKALKLLASSPLFQGLRCHVVHVTSSDHPEQALLTQAEKQLQAANISCTTAHLQGKVATTLANYQAQQAIDLTLMGAFSHNRVRDFLLGSLTHDMLMSTQTPLLLLR